MKAEKAALMILKGIVADMEPADRQKVEAARDEIKQAIAKHGESGQFALSYVALELAAEGQE